MDVKWLGHSCFLITSEKGLRVITDPYSVSGGIHYDPIKETADIVVVSHDHFDHNAVSAVPGKPEVVRGNGIRAVRGVQFRGVATYHDASHGKQRGANTVFCFTLDDIRLCHLGDLGHLLNQAQINEIGAVDILFVPTGGFYTIDAAGASTVCDQLRPKVIIPMHFRTAKCDFPIGGVEDFVRGKKNVNKMDSSRIEFKFEELPVATEIVVLKSAC